MKTVELGRTGQQVSQLALGCMIMGTQTDEATSFELLDRYAAAGGTFLDTANCYAWWLRQGSQGGESEELLGRWFARSGRRDEMFLATKGAAMVWDQDGVWNGGRPDLGLAFTRFEGAGAATLRTALEASLRRLRTDRIDLYYVHVDDRSTPLEETLAALAGFVQEGKIRYVGWSNVRTWRLERIRQLCARHGWPAPVALQQHHTYLRPRPGQGGASTVDDEQWDYLREHPDLTLVAYTPVLKGAYDDPAKRAGHAVLDPYRGADTDARLRVLDAVAAEVGATPNQVVLAWMLRQERPAEVPLVGPRTLDQYESAAAALAVALSDEQAARLDTAGEGAAP